MLAPALTPRQRQTAELICAGWPTKHIATELGVSPRRVRRIVAQLAARLGCDGTRDVRVEIVRRYRLDEVTAAYEHLGRGYTETEPFLARSGPIRSERGS